VKPADLRVVSTSPSHTIYFNQAKVIPPPTPFSTRPTSPEASRNTQRACCGIVDVVETEKVRRSERYRVKVLLPPLIMAKGC